MQKKVLDHEHSKFTFNIGKKVENVIERFNGDTLYVITSSIQI